MQTFEEATSKMAGEVHELSCDNKLKDERLTQLEEEKQVSQRYLLVLPFVNFQSQLFDFIHDQYCLCSNSVILSSYGVKSGSR